MAQSVDIDETRIRYLGYDVPVDMSRLPATTADSLVRTIQEACDSSDDGEDHSMYEVGKGDGIDKAVKGIREVIDDPVDPVAFGDLANKTAEDLAELVANNFSALSAEAAAPDRIAILTRWFVDEIRAAISAGADDAVETRLARVNDALDELDDGEG